MSVGHDLDEHRRRNLAAVESAFAAIGRGDAEGQLANYVDDLELQFPFTDPPKAVRGKAEALPYLTGAFGVFRFELTIDDVIACIDPDRLVIEAHSTGTYLPTGAAYVNTYVIVFRFRDGLIATQREFFDPTQAMRSAGTFPV